MSGRPRRADPRRRTGPRWATPRTRAPRAAWSRCPRGRRRQIPGRSAAEFGPKAGAPPAEGPALGLRRASGEV